MNTNDLKSSYKEKMMEGFKQEDPAMVAEAFEAMFDAIQEECEAKITGIKMDADKAILAQRGVRQLTSEEKTYYEKMAECMRSENPKQALSNAALAMPTTVVNAVFEELTTEHELLSRIDFTRVGGPVKVLMNTNGTQTATWGKLCAEIVKEITAGFKEVDAGLLKLSAFIPVCKAVIEMGYDWLDTFIRQTLIEALANGLENGIINGDGNDKPIGMVRDISDDVEVVGNAYPKKDAIAVTDFEPATIGAILAEMAVDGAGKARKVEDVILLVNPVDYYSKVMPATTIMAPDGTYRNNVLPYPITIIQSAAVEAGEAVIGIAKRYFIAAGMDKGGKLQYDDSYQFLEDNRVYMIKLYANGLAKDDNAFKLLDITGVKPALLKVKVVTDAEATNAEAGE